MSHLDLDAFLRAERAPAVDAEKNKDAARDRLEMILGPLAAVSVAASVASATDVASKTTSAAGTLARTKAILFLIGGFVAGVGAHAAVDHVRAKSASFVAPNAIATSSAAPPASATAFTTVEVPERDIESLPLAPTPSSPTPTTSSHAGTQQSSDLDAESTLLETARTALERNDPEHATIALDRHRQRFPNGQLREERESLTIYALVAEGKMDEARTKTAAFHRQFQNSLQGPALDKLVGAP